MDQSIQVPGSRAKASPCGGFIAHCANNKVRISPSHAPERIYDVNSKVATKDVRSLVWCDDALQVALLSAKVIEVFALDDDDLSCRVRIDNGSGGLGRIAWVSFLGTDHLLCVSEFGKAKVWDLLNGKGVDLPDVKMTGDGAGWEVRPASGQGTGNVLAMLSRAGAEDTLHLHFTPTNTTSQPIKLTTTDAKTLSWSPDGRWLVVRDTPIANPSVHIYTPDGHLFRTFPGIDTDDAGLSVKTMVWSGDSRLLALGGFDGRIDLLNTRTFTPMAIVEHATVIDQEDVSAEHRSIIWSERVSATGDRSFTVMPQPVNPPLSRPKSSNEVHEMGLAEAHFSSDGTFLASRDERMLNTVWIWKRASLAPQSVIILHSNVRKTQWHPTRPEYLIIDCGESIAYCYDMATGSAPQSVKVELPGVADFHWLDTATDRKPSVLCHSKSTFQILYPEGRDSAAIDQENYTGAKADNAVVYDEDTSEDSIFDVLSGRKPLPPKTDPSYTEMVDLEANSGLDGTTMRLEDTFHGKRRPPSVTMRDPLDDSDIF